MGGYIAALLVTTVILWIVGNLMTFSYQHHFIFKPIPLDSSYIFQFSESFEEINLSAPKNGEINALFFPSKTPETKGVILYYHGNSGNLQRWGEIAPDFTSRSYHFFVMDYRGFGKSSGPLNQNIMYSDAQNCYEYVQERFPNLDIIVYGRSIGSAMASYIAARNPCKKLILETPFYSMKDLFYTYYPFLPKIFVFKFPLENKENIKNVNCPVYIFQGDEDWVVPYRCSVKLKDALKTEDDYITIAGASHNDCRLFQIYQERLDKILE